MSRASWKRSDRTDLLNRLSAMTRRMEPTHRATLPRTDPPGCNGAWPQRSPRAAPCPARYPSAASVDRAWLVRRARACEARTNADLVLRCGQGFHRGRVRPDRLGGQVAAIPVRVREWVSAYP